ncbi:MAG: Sir2 family NAD-dependent protein deacetylase [Dehalococcoidia bacterium]|nr:Sir2 family NAD-dependent protein deacetylase [Dehalococcoidia bacterium]
MSPEEQNQESLTERAAEFITHSRKMVVFTGAGISTESGIPDFRSPGGVWSKYDPNDFTIQKFTNSAKTRRLVWEMMGKSGVMAKAEPNPAHHAIAELERLGKLDCIITQNVDNLHQIAGNSPDRVFELHGNMRWARCLNCNRRYPLERVAETAQAITEAPECPSCRGILKPGAVFFGETLPYDTLSRATEHSRSCDVFVVIGSTLTVNLSPTPMDRQASVLIRSKAGEAVPPIIDRVKAKLESHRRQRIK